MSMTKRQNTAVKNLHAAGTKPEEIARLLSLEIADVRAVLKPEAPARPKAGAAATAKQAKQAEQQQIATCKRHEEIQQATDLIRRSWRARGNSQASMGPGGRGWGGGRRGI